MSRNKVPLAGLSEAPTVPGPEIQRLAVLFGDPLLSDLVHGTIGPYAKDAFKRMLNDFSNGVALAEDQKPIAASAGTGIRIWWTTLAQQLETHASALPELGDKQKIIEFADLLTQAGGYDPLIST